MQLTVLAVTFLASVATARHFEIYPEVNFGGQAWAEDRNDDAACCMYMYPLIFSHSRQSIQLLTHVLTYSVGNLNGGGDHAQSVKGDGGCTTFYR